MSLVTPARRLRIHKITSRMSLGPEISDAGLRHLQGLKQLRWLDLAKTKITDTGLKYIEGLTQRERLVGFLLVPKVYARKIVRFRPEVADVLYLHLERFLKAVRPFHQTLPANILKQRGPRRRGESPGGTRSKQTSPACDADCREFNSMLD